MMLSLDEALLQQKRVGEREREDERVSLVALGHLAANQLIALSSTHKVIWGCEIELH